MQIPRPKLSRRASIALIAVGILIVMAGAALAIGPITRNVIAQDGLCLTCHAPTDPSLEVSARHPADTDKPAAACAECHIRPGFAGAMSAFGHFTNLTDFYGGFRSAYADRPGKKWIAPLARRAYRTRDGMRAADTAACRSCHIEEEIKPKKKRGQRAHAEALEEKLTCINCHYNLVHREVDPREDFVK
ncbi:MAG: hypothetical protein BMS9Abin10_0113 [Gammaproteobacteria bacterium]|nr:MAG: hypothetical protein BMS9Abin10_0113 [Gammaproteobacteria bacterium]